MFKKGAAYHQDTQEGRLLKIRRKSAITGPYHPVLELKGELEVSGRKIFEKKM